mgnify:CR=1 FL=1
MARWFQHSFGFAEPKNFAAVQRCFRASEEPSDGSVPAAAGPVHVLSTATEEEGGGLAFHVGPFEDPQVSDLRSRVRSAAESNDAPQGLGGLSFENIAGESRSMHVDPANAGAVFQVASQFNCLEMVGPDVRPEDGVTRYAYDRTQGPACAMACPSGTVWRNYFWAGRGQAGGDDHQLDTTRDAAALLENQKHHYWQMTNGYLLPTRHDGLAELAQRLSTQPGLRDEVRSALRAGVHWDTATEATPPHRVAQVFCSAVPVAYARGASDADWEPLARLALEASYEATLLVGAALAYHRQQRVAVYLTCVGGGAFGNATEWVHDAMQRACDGLKGMVRCRRP